MARTDAARATALTSVKMVLRFGLPLAGLVVFGDAILRSVGGDIEHWQFALGILLILAGFTSKLVPRS
jgi:small neutral amino acid transporter SnatA (MarC family)